MTMHDIQIVSAWPACLEEQDDGNWLVRFRQFPEALTEGDSREDALQQAADCLEEAIATRATLGQRIPLPASALDNEELIDISPVIAAKAALHDALRRQGVARVELARRLACDEKEARRLLDFRHPSKIGRLTEALKQLGLGVRTSIVVSGEEALHSMATDIQATLQEWIALAQRRPEDQDMDELVAMAEVLLADLHTFAAAAGEADDPMLAKLTDALQSIIDTTRETASPDRRQVAKARRASQKVSDVVQRLTRSDLSSAA